MKYLDLQIFLSEITDFNMLSLCLIPTYFSYHSRNYIIMITISLFITIAIFLHSKCTYYLQVNANGVVSLDRRYFTSTPRSLPLTGTNKIIAPYWADVDTRGTGNIYYRQTTDPDLLARATSEIRAVFPMSQSVTITNMFIATWDSVGYYSRSTDKVRQYA